MNVECIIAHAFGIAVGIVITLMVQKVGRDAEKSAERRYQVEKPYLDSLPKPIPHSMRELLYAWDSFSETTRAAYGSFERYKNHMGADPSRGLDNPVPQPMPMHIEPSKPWRRQ